MTVQLCLYPSVLEWAKPALCSTLSRMRRVVYGGRRKGHGLLSQNNKTANTTLEKDLLCGGSVFKQHGWNSWRDCNGICWRLTLVLYRRARPSEGFDLSSNFKHKVTVSQSEWEGREVKCIKLVILGDCIKVLWYLRDLPFFFFFNDQFKCSPTNFLEPQKNGGEGPFGRH